MSKSREKKPCGFGLFEKRNPGFVPTLGWSTEGAFFHMNIISKDRSVATFTPTPTKAPLFRYVTLIEPTFSVTSYLNCNAYGFKIFEIKNFSDVLYFKCPALPWPFVSKEDIYFIFISVVSPVRWIQKNVRFQIQGIKNVLMFSSSNHLFSENVFSIH